MAVAKGWLEGGREMDACCLMGIEVQFCKMKSSENWLHNNVNVLNCTLKNNFDGKFYVTCILHVLKLNHTT